VVLSRSQKLLLVEQVLLWLLLLLHDRVRIKHMLLMLLLLALLQIMIPW
jgi:hypothetical protein